ncbi:MAG TPA: glucokinase [Candidatus Saccharimonadales bacterium]|nr:glucokinase [Candidatus Saccharimonadales bacterium]
MTSERSGLLLPIDATLCTGIDIGGTKITIADTATAAVRHYDTIAYTGKGVDALLMDYFRAIGKRPRFIMLAIAGPRDDETGAVQLTNADWPTFVPVDAAASYPGTGFETTNDLTAAIAGVIGQSGIDLEDIKPGTPAPTGTKLVVTLSTGINCAAAVWDAPTKRYSFVTCEAGHIGFQPKNSDELAYLDHLQQVSTAEHKHVSVELALSGKYGIESLTDHILALHKTDTLAAAVKRARQAGRPTGAVLREIAEQGDGNDRAVARIILHHLGNMIGSALRDYAVLFKATGGVYMTGSVSLGLADYFAKKTDFIKRFIHPGAAHSGWIERIPIYLVTDPYITVRGALALARQGVDAAG